MEREQTMKEDNSIITEINGTTGNGEVGDSNSLIVDIMSGLTEIVSQDRKIINFHLTVEHVPLDEDEIPLKISGTVFHGEDTDVYLPDDTEKAIQDILSRRKEYKGTLNSLLRVLDANTNIPRSIPEGRDDLKYMCTVIIKALTDTIIGMDVSSKMEDVMSINMINLRFADMGLPYRIKMTSPTEVTLVKETTEHEERAINDG